MNWFGASAADGGGLQEVLVDAQVAYGRAFRLVYDQAFAA
jgi:hypothetical protein